LTLYVVRIERTIIVDSLSEEDALLDGQEAERREAENEPESIDVQPIMRLADIPNEWRGNCRPYGRDDDLTVEQALAKQGQPGT
jgi:hypothetical protein